VFKNFIVSGDGAGLQGMSSKNENTACNLEGGYGQFNLGYIVYSGKRSILYPTVGIGGGGYTVEMTKLGSGMSSNFNQQLQTPSGMFKVTAGGWMLNGQITYQYFLHPETTQGFFIGLREGYRYSPKNWEMKMNNAGLTNAPKINMNGFYASIIIGGGGIDRN